MMKCEDFEELVGLLRAWLRAADAEGSDAKREHSKLKEWAESHNQQDVRSASDLIALRSGLDIERRGHSHSVKEIGNPNGKSFSSAVDAIDYLLRRIVEADSSSAIEVITQPPYPWQAKLPIENLDRSLVAIRQRLGEELKHLEGDDARIPSRDQGELLQSMFDGNKFDLKTPERTIIALSEGREGGPVTQYQVQKFKKKLRSRMR